MPVHGISLDLEFGLIVGGAALLSYFVSGHIVSNTLFTTLIAVLFFLIGLHFDTGKIKRCLNHRKNVLLGWTLIYVVSPLVAIPLALSFDPGLGKALVAVGVSAAAIGSPMVFSNRGGGDGDTALIISTSSLLLGVLAVPLLLFIISSSTLLLDLQLENMASKTAIVVAPLLLGVFSQRFENTLLEDMRHHFSKVALWFLVLAMLIQLKLIYTSGGLAHLGNIGLGTMVLAFYTLTMTVIGYVLPRSLGTMEPQSRSISMVSGSKNLAIALFIASQLSAEAVAYVMIYYFVRQAVTGGFIYLLEDDRLNFPEFR